MTNKTDSTLAVENNIAPVLQKRKGGNLRRKTLITIGVIVGFILVVTIWGTLIKTDSITTDFMNKNLAPSLSHPFGTDWMGRDMLLRTIKGLSISIYIGILASGTGVLIATILGIMSATLGKTVDTIISFFVDLFLSTPHLLTIIIVCFAVGGGIKGVIIGVVATHWASMTRIIRAEVKQILTNDYVHVSRQLGISKFKIATTHILPSIIPQIIVGFVATFPHAILHEASITFLGFGLSPLQPAIGIILSESMKYLAIGYWWLAVLPGLSLFIIVILFDILGENVKTLLNPKTLHS